MTEGIPDLKELIHEYLDDSDQIHDGRFPLVIYRGRELDLSSLSLAVQEINHPSLLTSVPPFIPPVTLGYAIGRVIGRSLTLPLVYGTMRIGGRIRWFAGDGG